MRFAIIAPGLYLATEKTMPVIIYDVIVVGGGAMGLAAAYYLSQAGKSVLVLEQYEFVNQLGSTAGDSRYFRVMHSDPVMLLLAQSALKLWRTLEEVAGETLFDPRGVLFYGAESNALTAKLSLAKTRQVMETFNAPHKLYNAAGLKDSFAMFAQVPDNYIGLLDESGGNLRVGPILRAFHRLARRRGATLQANEMVSGIDWRGQDAVTVTTNQAQYQAEKVILTPSAWANQILQTLKPVRTQLNLTILEMTVAYYAVDVTFDDAPLWYEFGPARGDNQGLFYGLPPFERTGQMKGGADFARYVYPSPERLTRRPDKEVMAFTQTLYRERLRGIDPTPMPGSATTCLYTLTPDSHFVLDFLPQTTNIILFTGGSGQAFKFTPLIGSILAELALCGASQYNLTAFRINRPGIIQS
jgi:monomeric sarcosine oxidase